MKSECGFCKSEDVETAWVDGDMVVMCPVCNMESVVLYPESINYFDSEINDDYASSQRDKTIRFHI